MLAFSFSSLLVLLFAGPLLNSSSLIMMMNDSTSISNATLDSALVNDSSVFSGSLPVKSSGVNSELLSEDFSKIAIDVESGVRLVGPGRVKLQMSSSSLDIKANLKRCRGKAFFCYDALDGNKLARDLCTNNYCGFKLSDDGDFLQLISNHWLFDDIVESDALIHMENNHALYGHYRTAKQGLKEFGDASCDPAFGEGNILSLYVHDVSDGCIIEIPNAKVYHEPEPTHLVSSGNPAETTEAAEAGIPWYGWVLGVAALLIVIGIIAGIAICWYFKIGCFKGRSTPPKKIRKMDTDSMKSIVVKTEAAGTQPKKPKEKTVVSMIEKTSDEDVKTPPKPSKHAKKAAMKEKSLHNAQEPTRTAEAKSIPSFTCEEPPPSAPVINAPSAEKIAAPPASEEKPPLPVRDAQEFEAGVLPAPMKKAKRKHRPNQRQLQKEKKPPSLEENIVPGSNMDICKGPRYRSRKETYERRKSVGFKF